MKKATENSVALVLAVVPQFALWWKRSKEVISVDKVVSELSQKELLIEMLTLQYIKDKAANSPAEYVELYRKTKEEIKSSCETHFNIGNLI